MENSTLILTLLSALLANTISAENIEISTTSTRTPSTLNPHVEKLTESEEEHNSFLKTVEKFLNDGKNSDNLDSENQIQGYIPQPMVPVYPAYNSGGYFYPGVNPNNVAQTQSNDIQSSNYFSAVLPAAQAALQAGLKLFAKVGLFVMGGAALLIIGGIFTTLVCHVTPLCTITFNGYDFKALNKETVRSLMTPEKIASAAALVQDAIGKYQRLQRAVGTMK